MQTCLRMQAYLRMQAQDTKRARRACVQARARARVFLGSKRAHARSRMHADDSDISTPPSAAAERSVVSGMSGVPGILLISFLIWNLSRLRERNVGCVAADRVGVHQQALERYVGACWQRNGSHSVVLHDDSDSMMIFCSNRMCLQPSHLARSTRLLLPLVSPSPRRPHPGQVTKAARPASRSRASRTCGGHGPTRSHATSNGATHANVVADDEEVVALEVAVRVGVVEGVVRVEVLELVAGAVLVVDLELGGGAVLGKDPEPCKGVVLLKDLELCTGAELGKDVELCTGVEFGKDVELCEGVVLLTDLEVWVDGVVVGGLSSVPADST